VRALFPRRSGRATYPPPPSSWLLIVSNSRALCPRTSHSSARARSWPRRARARSSRRDHPRATRSAPPTASDVRPDLHEVREHVLAVTLANASARRDRRAPAATHAAAEGPGTGTTRVPRASWSSRDARRRHARPATELRRSFSGRAPRIRHSVRGRGTRTFLPSPGVSAEEILASPAARRRLDGRVEPFPTLRSISRSPRLRGRRGTGGRSSSRRSIVETTRKVRRGWIPRPGSMVAAPVGLAVVFDCASLGGRDSKRRSSRAESGARPTSPRPLASACALAEHGGVDCDRGRADARPSAGGRCRSRRASTPVRARPRRRRRAASGGRCGGRARPRCSRRSRARAGSPAATAGRGRAPGSPPGPRGARRARSRGGRARTPPGSRPARPRPRPRRGSSYGTSRPPTTCSRPRETSR
jgi:hypothetical protein